MEKNRFVNACNLLDIEKNWILKQQTKTYYLFSRLDTQRNV